MITKLNETVNKFISDNWELSDKIVEFNGTLKSNTCQIVEGHLSYENDEVSYMTKTGISYQLLSTSQQEGENGRLNSLVKRRVGIDILERLLLLFSYDINIRQGVKCGRILLSALFCDPIELCKTISATRANTFGTKEKEWVINLLSSKLSTSNISGNSSVYSSNMILEKNLNEIFNISKNNTTLTTTSLDTGGILEMIPRVIFRTFRPSLLKFAEFLILMLRRNILVLEKIVFFTLY